MKIVIEFYLSQNTHRRRQCKVLGIFYDVQCASDVCGMWKGAESLQKILKYVKKGFSRSSLQRASFMPSHFTRKICLISLRALRAFFVMLNNFFARCTVVERRRWWLLKWCNWIFSPLALAAVFASSFLTQHSTLQSSRLRACLLLSRTHRLDTENYCHIAFVWHTCLLSSLPSPRGHGKENY